jgi:hypothetical protein
MWLAGGGIKPGITIGESDELGFNVVRDKVHRARSARDHPETARLRAYAVYLSIPGTELPADRCGGTVVEKICA